MNVFLDYVDFNDFLTDFASGDLNWITGLVWLAIATAFSILGGAIGGVILARKDLGYQLSAMIGGLFGPAGVLPAIIVGLLVLKFT